MQAPDAGSLPPNRRGVIRIITPSNRNHFASAIGGQRCRGGEHELPSKRPRGPVRQGLMHSNLRRIPVLRGGHTRVVAQARKKSSDEQKDLAARSDWVALVVLFSFGPANRQRLNDEGSRVCLSARYRDVYADKYPGNTARGTAASLGGNRGSHRKTG